VATDGGPGDRKERRDLAGAEIAAGQGGHDLSAGRVSDRGEHFHAESVTAQLRVWWAIRFFGFPTTGSAATQLFQQRELAERVVVGDPVDVLDAERRGLVEVCCNLFGRAEQRSALVQRVRGDVAFT
jgi:hypothetical protein